MLQRRFRQFVLRRVSTSVVVAALSQTAMACHDSSTTPLVATSIAPASGSAAQTGVVGQALSAPVTVVVTDQNGAPLANATVSWLVSSADGTLSAQTSTTDANGDASVSWTLGTVAGLDSLVASLPNGTSTIITANAAAGGLTSLVISAGNGQNVSAGTATAPLIVKAVDQFGNAVANASISWASSGGGALSATTGLTDGTGLSEVTFTTDPSPASYSVTASAGGSMSVTFTVTGS